MNDQIKPTLDASSFLIVGATLIDILPALAP